MKENPLILPFLRDLAMLSWPAWDITRLILADRLDDLGDARAEAVRAAAPDLWDGTYWIQSAFVLDLDLHPERNVQTYQGRDYDVSPRSRHEVLKHFAPLRRMQVVAINRHSSRRRDSAGRVVILGTGWWVFPYVFKPGDWRPHKPHHPAGLWKRMCHPYKTGCRTPELAEARARRWIARHPDDDYEPMLPITALPPANRAGQNAHHAYQFSSSAAQGRHPSEAGSRPHAESSRPHVAAEPSGPDTVRAGAAGPDAHE